MGSQELFMCRNSVCLHRKTCPLCMNSFLLHMPSVQLCMNLIFLHMKTAALEDSRLLPIVESSIG